ncbi:hypothetical protein C2I18_13020 [Paenibacillus sp. PK3_47]|uniref:hypothetical protein n=1 Tax=Paenibacillus sp. PK3_47 TaxID=2072642 RepID=UPI00201E0FB6|nr:hypothetical protein [Paenibacillus sp. PK3_47]UQZ34357.1 hypothetical protein C2I18_13020 [Paenibacillus sp. PK3_47]
MIVQDSKLIRVSGDGIEQEQELFPELAQQHFKNSDIVIDYVILGQEGIEEYRMALPESL